MPESSTLQLTNKTRGFLKDQYHYQQILNDPKKVVDLYDTYYQLWRRLPNNGSFEYAKPFLEKAVEENGRIIDYTTKSLNVLSYRYPQLKPVSSLIEMTKIYGEGLAGDRNSLGKKLLSEDSNGDIYRMLKQIPELEQVMGEIIRDNQTKINGESFANAALDNINLLNSFNALLDTPNSDEELILKAPVNSLQELLSDSIKSAIERANVEGSEHYDDILEEELKKQGVQIDDLNKKLSEYFEKAVLTEELKKKTIEEISYQMNEARGWASIVGSLISIKNKKLGDFVSNGSKAIIDSYEAFSLISKIGFSAATFATGVGGVVSVISLINSFQSEDQDQTGLLFEGLGKINENINNLRNEVDEISNNVIYLIDQVEYLIQSNSSKLEIINDNIKKLINKLDEYNKLNLDAEFENRINEIKNINSPFKLKPSPSDFITDLGLLYYWGVRDATNSRYTRINDLINSNYDFLSLRSITKYDAFRWSPIERRPILIENLRKFFLSSKVAESDLEFWQAELPSIKNYLPDDCEYINPIICSSAFREYSQMLLKYFLYFCSEQDAEYNQVSLSKINDFYSIFSWFNKTTFCLSSEKMIRLTLEKYIANSLELLNKIIHINKSNLYEYTIDNNIKPRIQLDAFLLNPISTKFENPLLFQEVNFIENENYIKNFFSFSTFLKIPFDPWSGFLLTPPFLSTINQPKIDELNKHYDNLIKNLPNNIDNFIYLLGIYINMGILKVERNYYLGSNLIDPNVNYFRPNFYGDLTIEYTITVDKQKSSINRIDKTIKITIADTRLGTATLFNYHGPTFTGTTFNFPKSIGNGSITLWHEYSPLIATYPPNLFSQDFFDQIDMIFSPDNISSFKKSLSELKDMGVYVGISTKDEFSTKITADSSLDNLREETRNSWINLATAILCHSESNLDTSIYFELLDKKPILLDTSISMSDEKLIDYIIGDNLSDLLLLWVNREKDENKNRLPFKGINVRGGLENQDFFKEEMDILKEDLMLPTLWLNFDEGDKENPISYELYKPQVDEMIKNIVTPKDSIFYGSILPSCDEALCEIEKLFSFFNYEK